MKFTGIFILARLNLGPNIGLSNYCRRTQLVSTALGAFQIPLHETNHVAIN